MKKETVLFNGLTETEQARFKQAIQAAGANFCRCYGYVQRPILNSLDEDDPSTLSGAIKGASQESIDLLAGQTNAVRVNQVTSLQLFAATAYAPCEHGHHVRRDKRAAAYHNKQDYQHPYG